MSELLGRLRALRGDVDTGREEGSQGRAPHPEQARGPALVPAAVTLDAEVVTDDLGSHLIRSQRWPARARHGRVELGTGGLHPTLTRWASRNLASVGDPGAGVGAALAGRVAYLDTETTGLAGGTGTYAFLVGVGRHDGEGFRVEQRFLPGPEHEASYLRALQASLDGVAAVVTYNGASFDLPLLRTRFALHGLSDPLDGVPHLDLLPLARRLWRVRLPDCTLGTVERDVLGAVRSAGDVPGSEVPLRYLSFLRSRDAAPLLGVLEHNTVDIVALAALQRHIEALLDPLAGTADPGEAHALGRWFEVLGDNEVALAHYLAAEERLSAAIWEAARLLRRSQRLSEAVERWERLASLNDPRGWIELAKHREHRLGDLSGALRAVAAARRCGGDALDDLGRRERRLLERLDRVAP